jgi:hypothetical protein
MRSWGIIVICFWLVSRSPHGGSVKFIDSSRSRVNSTRLQKQSLIVFTLLPPTGHTVRDITELCYVSVHVSK